MPAGTSRDNPYSVGHFVSEARILYRDGALDFPV